MKPFKPEHGDPLRIIQVMPAPANILLRYRFDGVSVYSRPSAMALVEFFGSPDVCFEGRFQRLDPLDGDGLLVEATYVDPADDGYRGWEVFDSDDDAARALAESREREKGLSV